MFEDNERNYIFHIKIYLQLTDKRGEFEAKYIKRENAEMRLLAVRPLASFYVKAYTLRVLFFR